MRTALGCDSTSLGAPATKKVCCAYTRGCCTHTHDARVPASRVRAPWCFTYSPTLLLTCLLTYLLTHVWSVKHRGTRQTQKPCVRAWRSAAVKNCCCGKVGRSVCPPRSSSADLWPSCRRACPPLLFSGTTWTRWLRWVATLSGGDGQDCPRPWRNDWRFHRLSARLSLSLFPLLVHPLSQSLCWCFSPFGRGRGSWQPQLPRLLTHAFRSHSIVRGLVCRRRTGRVITVIPAC